MDYEFMNYAGESDSERIANAYTRRQKGAALLNKIKHIKQEWHRIFEHAKVQGIKPAAILEKYIRKNPAAIESAKDYIRSRGIVPSEDLHEIAMQYCRLRDQQVNDVVDMYDVDNYEISDEENDTTEGDDNDNLFGRTGKKYRLKHEGLSRREVRQRRRAQRKGNKEEAGEAAVSADAAKAPENVFEDGQTQPAAESPLPLPKFTNVLPPVELQAPSQEEAEAEILGEESDYEGFDGEHEENLPAIKAIDLLGRLNYDGYESDNATGADTTKKKVDWGKLFENLKDTAGEVSKTAKVIKDSKGKAINAGEIFNDIKEHETVKEKKNFLKENAPYIVIGIVIIVCVGVVIGSKS